MARESAKEVTRRRRVQAENRRRNVTAAERRVDRLPRHHLAGPRVPKRRPCRRRPGWCLRHRLQELVRPHQGAAGRSAAERTTSRQGADGCGEAAAAIGSLVPGVEPRGCNRCSASRAMREHHGLGPQGHGVLPRDLRAWVRAFAEIVETPRPRKSPPRHSAASSAVVRTDRRSAGRPRKSTKTAGALLPLGAVGVGAAVMATDHDLLTNAMPPVDPGFC